MPVSDASITAVVLMSVLVGFLVAIFYAWQVGFDEILGATFF